MFQLLAIVTSWSNGDSGIFLTAHFLAVRLANNFCHFLHDHCVSEILLFLTFFGLEFRRFNLKILIWNDADRSTPISFIAERWLGSRSGFFLFLSPLASVFADGRPCLLWVVPFPFPVSSIAIRVLVGKSVPSRVSGCVRVWRPPLIVYAASIFCQRCAHCADGIFVEIGCPSSRTGTNARAPAVTCWLLADLACPGTG